MSRKTIKKQVVEIRGHKILIPTNIRVEQITEKTKDLLIKIIVDAEQKTGRTTRNMIHLIKNKLVLVKDTGPAQSEDELI